MTGQRVIRDQGVWPFGHSRGLDARRAKRPEAVEPTGLRAARAPLNYDLVKSRQGIAPGTPG
jgi:hypothetical protein